MISRESEHDKLEKRKTREGKEEKRATANKKRKIYEAQTAQLFLTNVKRDLGLNLIIIIIVVQVHCYEFQGRCDEGTGKLRKDHPNIDNKEEKNIRQKTVCEQRSNLA